jgi:anti-sigma regulatory factor (Ser/Thr protein kinase)
MPTPTRSRWLLLAAIPRSVSRARAYARDMLVAWELPAMTDTVELLVSELVTNAVAATGLIEDRADGCTASSVYLCLSLLEGVLLIEVWDVSSAAPLKRVVADDESGRGLLLVETLSKDWGCRTLGFSGKIVWCECLTEGV